MWQHWVVGISVKWNVASSLHSPHKLSGVYIFSVFESIQTKDHCIKFLSIVKHSIFLLSVLSNTEAKAIEIIYMYSITVFPSYSMSIVRYVYSKLLGWTWYRLQHNIGNSVVPFCESQNTSHCGISLLVDDPLIFAQGLRKVFWWPSSSWPLAYWKSKGYPKMALNALLSLYTSCSPRLCWAKITHSQK